MAAGLSDPLAALRLQPTASLPIRRPDDLPNISLSFINHRTLGSFAIDEEQTYVKGQEPPIIRLPANLATLNIDLKMGENKVVRFSKSNEYRMSKHEFFFKWLLDEYVTPDGGPFAHDFIGFCGRFTEILKTPFIRLNDKYRNGEWQIFAVKFNGSIFLLNAMMCQEPEDVGAPTIGVYCGQRFRHLLTTDDPAVDENSKVFVFRESNFGRHKILCLKEIDAMDDRKSYVELKMHINYLNSENMKLNRLDYWALCVPAGVENLAVGKRSRDGILEDIRLCQTRDLKANNGLEWNSFTCYAFANRMLNWIQSHLVEDDPTVVKEFRWCAGKEQVEVVDTLCVDVACLLIPEWFVEGVQAKRRQQTTSTEM